WKTHRTREILITTLFIMKAFLEIILGHFSVHQGYRIGLYFSRNGVSFEYYRKVPTTVSTGIFWISRLLLICFDEVHAEFRCAGRLYFVNGFIQLILIFRRKRSAYQILISVFRGRPEQFVVVNRFRKRSGYEFYRTLNPCGLRLIGEILP